VRGEGEPVESSTGGDPSAGRRVAGIPGRLRISLAFAGTYAWALAGSVAAALGQWVILLMLVREVSASAVGEYVLGIAISAPIALFLSFGLRTVVATDHAGAIPAGTYYIFRLLTVALAYVAIAAVALIGSYSPGTAGIILIVGLAKCVELVADLGYGFLQRSGRMDQVGRLLVLKNFVSTAAAVVTLRLTGSVIWTVTVISVIGLVLLLTIDRSVWSRFGGVTPASLRFRWTVAQQRALLRTAAPLGVAAGLISLHVNLPRYVLERAAGTAELGEFGALTQLVMAINLILIAAGNVVLPKLTAAIAAEDRDAFSRIGSRMLGLGLVVGVGGLSVATVAGPGVLSFIYGAEYAAAAPVFLVLMGWAALGYIAHVLFLGMAAFQLFSSQLAVYATSLVVTGFLSLLLVPTHGAIGAATAMALGVVVQIVCFAFLLYRQLRKGSFTLNTRQVSEQPVGTESYG
jgi:O-antigen/teichoic acid export membrane protein